MPLSAAEDAREFARAYVRLTEALQREGVPPETAREEARLAAFSESMERMDQAVQTYDPAKGPCPVCERG